MSNDHAGAVERLRQDILDPQGVWRHCRVAMVNKYDTEEVVGFPSFTVDDLRTVLSALSASEARANAAEAERDEVNALRVAIFKVLLDEAKVLVAPGEEPDAIRRLIERDRASEARLRVAVEGWGRLARDIVDAEDDARANPMGGLSLGGLMDCRDNSGCVYQSAALAETIKQARAALATIEDKPHDH